MKQLKQYLLLLALTASGAVSAQTENDPHYKVALERFQKYYNAGQADSLFQMFSPAMQTGLPLDKTKSTVSSLLMQLGKMKAASLLSDEGQSHSYKAVFDQATVKLVLSLDAQQQLKGLWVQPYAEPVQSTNDGEAFTITAANGNVVAGTLTMPGKATAPVPVVLIIAGSGPTDRNCNSIQGLNTDAYRMLADSLGAHGIATLRYDKRGIGQSLDAQHLSSDLRFEDMVADAVALIKKLQADQRFSGVYVVGHSEGALVGLEAALQQPVAGYVSLAGIAESADKTIVRQLSEQSKELGAKAAVLMKDLKQGKMVTTNDPDLEALFHKSVQPYLVSWIKYNPAADIKKLKTPILILQGTTDIQVRVADAQALHAAVPKSKMILLEGMNHILKDAPADRQQNLGTYSNPALPLNAALVQALTGFINIP